MRAAHLRSRSPSPAVLVVRADMRRFGNASSLCAIFKAPHDGR